LFDQFQEGILHEVFGGIDVPTPSVENQCREPLIDDPDEFLGGEKRLLRAHVVSSYK
jgi:hypothetical protein